jgi:hypothetical protein
MVHGIRSLEAIMTDEERLLVRARLEQEHGQVWNTEELQRDFDVQGFLAPFVGVVRRSDGVKGSLMFVPYPRFYYGFEAAND